MLGTSWITDVHSTAQLIFQGKLDEVITKYSTKEVNGPDGVPNYVAYKLRIMLHHGRRVADTVKDPKTHKLKDLITLMQKASSSEAEVNSTPPSPHTLSAPRLLPPIPRPAPPPPPLLLQFACLPPTLSPACLLPSVVVMGVEQGVCVPICRDISKKIPI